MCCLRLIVARLAVILGRMVLKIRGSQDFSRLFAIMSPSPVTGSYNIVIKEMIVNDNNSVVSNKASLQF